MTEMKAYWLQKRKVAMPPMTEEKGVWYFWSYTEDQFLPYQRICGDDFQRIDLKNEDCARWGIAPTNQRMYIPVEWTEYVRKDLYIAEGIPDTLTLLEAGVMAVGAKYNKAVLSPEWQAGFKRFVEVVKPTQVIYVPDNERPAMWNAKQDNVRYWHETFQKLAPKSWCVDWRQLQRKEFEQYRAWCVSWWKQQHRKPQREEDAIAWQKSDVNDLWCAATSKAAFLQTMQRCFTRTPLYPTIQFGSKPKYKQEENRNIDPEKALIGLIRTVEQAQADRNVILHWAACRAAEKGLRREAKPLLMHAALRCGLQQYEAERTIASAFK